MTLVRGLVVHEGPSRLDGAPVVLIVTLNSHNRKIGEMAQAWILRADLPPREALARGLDASICGTCVHRSGGVTGRSCYVNTQTGPTTIFKTYTRGFYPRLDPERAAGAICGLQVRVSAYGDPVVLPFELWRTLLEHVAGFTFYSHLWRVCDQRFRSIAMASVESEGEVDEAHRLGWRTFRTRLHDEPLRLDELVCPASDEGGHAVTCAQCRLCVGAQREGARSIAIYAHGQRTRWFAERKAAVLA